MRTNGLSIIELLIVITIIILFMVIGIPRFQELNTESSFKKDVTYFIENIGRARALVESTNSRRCDPGKKLERIEIVRADSSGYTMDSYCESIPEVVERIPFSLLSSQFDTDFSDEIFTILRTDGTVSPSTKGFMFTRGNLRCNVLISNMGIMRTQGDTCP